MQDGIISGNGNSRYLKTVSAALGLYSTYEDFMAALIAGTFPIDLNGINTAGWTQQGTALNKANLFSDTTASALGLTASNTPNDALAKITSLINNLTINTNSRAKVQLVSYIGTGTAGPDGMSSVSFSFAPSVIFALCSVESTGAINTLDNTINKQIASLWSTSLKLNCGFGDISVPASSYYGKKSSDGRTFSWYHDFQGQHYASSQFNEAGVTYYYLGIV